MEFNKRTFDSYQIFIYIVIETYKWFIGLNRRWKYTQTFIIHN